MNLVKNHGEKKMAYFLIILFLSLIKMLILQLESIFVVDISVMILINVKLMFSC